MQLNKANSTDIKVTFLDLHLLISNGFVSSKIMTIAMILIFDIFSLPLLDGDFPGAHYYGVYISQLIRFVECLVIWLTTMLVIKLRLLNFSNRGIGIINLGKFLLSFIVDTMNWSLFMKPD